jgi:hypothetical protein
LLATADAEYLRLFLMHEVIEAQVFRQMMADGELDDAFARHVVDDIVLPLLAGSTAQAEPSDNR